MEFASPTYSAPWSSNTTCSVPSHVMSNGNTVESWMATWRSIPWRRGTLMHISSRLRRRSLELFKIQLSLSRCDATLTCSRSEITARECRRRSSCTKVCGVPQKARDMWRSCYHSRSQSGSSSTGAKSPGSVSHEHWDTRFYLLNLLQNRLRRQGKGIMIADRQVTRFCEPQEQTWR